MALMTRRGFLQTAGMVSLGSMLGGSFALRTLAATMDPGGVFEYTGWENFHRDQWS